MDGGEKDSGKTPAQSPEVLNEQAAELLDRLAARSQDELDLDDLDIFLDQLDPNFKTALDTIAQDTDLKAVDVESDDQAAAYFEEVERWKNSSGFPHLLYKVFPFTPRVSLHLKILYFKTKRWVIANWIQFKNTTHDFVLRTWKNSVTNFKSRRQDLAVSTKKSLRDFKFLSWRVKARLYLTLMLGFGGTTVVILMLQGKLIPRDSNLFISSLEDVATGTYHYNPEDSQEYFYDNIRSVPNLFLVPKVITNIKPSMESGPNPMAAIEFFAEGFTPEVIIEMKDREPALRDLAARTIEDFSFDELESTSGKQKLNQVLAREFNRILSTGQVKAIRIKNIVLKP